jgi:hypothetical protein
VADTVAIVSVVSGAAVGIGVPWINTRLERSKMWQQLASGRADELRTVLDAGAEAIFAARAPVIPHLEEMGDSAPTSWDRATVVDIEKFEGAVSEIFRCQRKLAIRLGPKHPIYRAYYQVADGFGKARSRVVMAQRTDEPVDADEFEALFAKIQHDEHSFESEASKVIGVGETKQSKQHNGRLNRRHAG